jgi:hypothetical protein
MLRSKAAPLSNRGVMAITSVLLSTAFLDVEAIVESRQYYHHVGHFTCTTQDATATKLHPDGGRSSPDSRMEALSMIQNEAPLCQFADGCNVSTTRTLWQNRH